MRFFRMHFPTLIALALSSSIFLFLNVQKKVEGAHDDYFGLTDVRLAGWPCIYYTSAQMPAGSAVKINYEKKLIKYELLVVNIAVFVVFQFLLFLAVERTVIRVYERRE